MIRNSVAYEKAYRFAVHAVETYRDLTERKREFVLSRQFLRSSTSIGANIAEANGSISGADFSSKISIAYKECLEAKYWLHLLKDTAYLEADAFEALHAKADEIARILFAILKKTRMDKTVSSHQRAGISVSSHQSSVINSLMTDDCDVC